MYWHLALALVSGTVVDAEGVPVPDARVTLQATTTATVTDGEGAFELEIPDGAATIVAAAPGYFHGAAELIAPAGEVVLTLEALPTDDDPDFALRTPLFCGNCHAQLDDWSDSPMALAGENTWVYDLYDGTGTPGGEGGFVYTRDGQHAEENPASECASCHQPETWSAEPFTAMLPLDRAGEQHGVSCDVCHRISSVDTTKPNFPGIYPGVVRLLRSNVALELGVLGDVSYTNGGMRAALQPQLTADVCAACHQDKNDHDLDGDFEDEGGVISEPTYLEWLASSYADPTSDDHATCVDCHMPPTKASSACRMFEPATPRPVGQVRSHRIEGTTAEYLEHAVRVTLEASVDGDELLVEAVVENHATGHHVPTGVTTRNMILLVEATLDADGAPLASTGEQVVDPLGGVGDPADGYFAGLPGKLYAKIPADAEGNTPVFFTEAATLASDTRIAAHDADVTAYRFAIPDGGGAVTVRARVIYRRAFRALVDAKAWTEDGHGRPLEDLAAPDFGHRMASAELAIDTPDPEDPGAGCGCQSSGEDAAGGVTLVLVLVIALGALRRRRSQWM